MGRLRVVGAVAALVASLAVAPGSEAAGGGYRVALVRDVAPGGVDSFPGDMVALRRTLLFSASTPAHGFELWRSRGTAAGTRLVKDVNPGTTDGQPDDSTAHNLTVVGNRVFFAADDGVRGTELWVTDGTRAGTRLVRDIYPGVSGAEPNSSWPGDFVALGNRLLFTAFNATHGTEVWRSDGTAAGTVPVKDVWPGGDGSAGNLFAHRGRVFFQADDGTNGAELWRTDGTNTGTVMVKDIYPGGDSLPGEFGAAGATVFFEAFTPAAGFELWKTNGTAAGTVLVKNIQPGGSSSVPDDVTALDGTTVLFEAHTNGDGAELWRSDGTAAGTVLVKDLNPGSSGGEADDGSPRNFLLRRPGQMLFSADGGGARGGRELWRSDGTAAGTTMVKDIQPGFMGSFPADLTKLRRTVLFAACAEDDGCELWQTNGTRRGTVMVTDTNPGANDTSPDDLTVVGARVLYSGSHPTAGNELFKVGPTFSVGDRQVSEGGRVRFTVRLSQAPAAEVSVVAVTREGTAQRGDDYRHQRRRLVFDPGERRRTFTVRTLGDTLDERAERFSVVLREARGADVADGRAAGTITDDD